MSLEGVSSLRKKPNWKKTIKSMKAIIEGKDIKKRKPRPKGLKYNREEDRIRPLIRDELRKQGFTVIRVEPTVRGKFGLGDFWVDKENICYAGWVEVKTKKGKLSDDQKRVRRVCKKAGISYIVLTSVEEAKEFKKLL